MLKQILKRKQRPVVISDFDGTISTRDISYEILDRFSTGGWEGIDAAYVKGEIGSQEAFRLILERITATKEQLVGFIDEFPDLIDPHFVEFYRYLKTRGIDLVILSDGFAFYINRLLERVGISDIPIYANDIVEGKDGRLVPIFPHHNGECDKCGTCKSSVVKKFKEDHDHIIFIGDGYSDLCASELADTLFAKRRLMQHAAEKELAFTYFHDFADVQAEFEKDVCGAIFDLDGTLVDSLDSIRTALNHTIDTLHIDVDADKAFKDMMSWPLSTSMEMIFPGVDPARLVAVFREKYYPIYKEMTTIKPGITDLLAGLSEDGVRMTIATNKLSVLAKELVSHLGIDHYFDAVLGVGDVQSPKPSPEMAEEAIRRMGTTRETTVFIGDSRVDIETAKNSLIDCYIVSDSIDTPGELIERKPRKLFSTTSQLTKELTSRQ